MFSRTLPKTATGPGTMVGGKFHDNTNHTANSARIERTLRIEFIADEVFWNGFHDGIAQYLVHKLQVILLNGDLFLVPDGNNVRSHLLREERHLFWIGHI